MGFTCLLALFSYVIDNLNKEKTLLVKFHAIALYNLKLHLSQSLEE